MFSKKTVRRSKAAIVALLLSVNKTSAMMVTKGNDTDTTTVAVDPDFVSSMTKNHWKLYKPDETLAMYQKAEFKVNESINDLQMLDVGGINA